MNILLATLGSYGDVCLTVGIGVRLAQRGHTVTLFTNEQYRPLARQHGHAQRKRNDSGKSVLA